MSATPNLREQILAAQDREIREVQVPEWGLTVRVSAMSGRDRDLWEAEIIARRAPGGQGVYDNMRASLLARCLVDEAGERIFAEADVEALGRKSARALNRLFDVASELNAISEADQKELVKN